MVAGNEHCLWGITTVTDIRLAFTHICDHYLVSPHQNHHQTTPRSWLLLDWSRQPMFYTDWGTSGCLFSEWFIESGKKGLDCWFELVERGKLTLFKNLRNELFSELCDVRPRMPIQYVKDRHTFGELCVPCVILHVMLPPANRCLKVIDICEFLRWERYGGLRRGPYYSHYYTINHEQAIRKEAKNISLTFRIFFLLSLFLLIVSYSWILLILAHMIYDETIRKHSQVGLLRPLLTSHLSQSSSRCQLREATSFPHRWRVFQRGVVARWRGLVLFAGFIAGGKILQVGDRNWYFAAFAGRQCVPFSPRCLGVTVGNRHQGQQSKQQHFAHLRNGPLPTGRTRQNSHRHHRQVRTEHRSHRRRTRRGASLQW